MKKITLIAMIVLISQAVFGQVKGNLDYQYQTGYSDQNPAQLSDNNINIDTSPTSDIFITVKGMANIKADFYVAIFSVTQVGKTAGEANDLIDKRISQALTDIKQMKGTETYIDMISFVPIYEFDVEKKVFSKKSYNEVPKGFELKKNIHIKFSDPNQLDDFIKILANQEIYDLVKVDYFSNSLENIKKALMDTAIVVLQEKEKKYETILGAPFTNIEKRIIDGYKVMLPVEMYKSYQAYNSSSLDLKKSADVNTADKSTTIYYQPIIDKEFDFVINPTILEPVIQVMYEIKLVINKEEQAAANDKKYILITPNGEMKPIDLNK